LNRQGAKVAKQWRREEEIYLRDEWHFLKRNLFTGNNLKNDGLARDKLGLVHDPGLADEEAAVASGYQRPHHSPRRFAPP